MQSVDTPIAGLKVLTPGIFRDERGYFFESYNARQLIAHGIRDNFVQDNEAFSSKGVLRGLHYQVGKSAQSKLLRVVKGSVYDVALDLRPESATYGEFYGIVLDSREKQQFYIPRGFAHGYLCLEDDTIVQYKCDNFYDKDAEGSVRFDDPGIAIPWQDFYHEEFIVSEKDISAPLLGNHKPF